MKQIHNSSDEFYSTIFHMSPIAMVIVQVDNNQILEINDTFTHLTNYASEEVIGKTAVDIGLWAKPEERPQLIETLHTRGSFRNFDFCMRIKSGELLNVLLSIEIIQRNGVSCYLALLNDITERKRVEEVLKQSEQKYSVLFHKSIYPAIMGKLPELTCTDVNDAFEQFLGYTREEMIGKTVPELGLIGDETRSHLLVEFQKKGSVQDYEIQVSTKSHETRVALLNINVIEFSGQKYSITTMQDITERKRAEQKLRESEENFRLLVEGVKDYAIFMLDPQGQIMNWNHGAEILKGYQREEIIGQHFSRFYTDEDIKMDKPRYLLERTVSEGRLEERGWRLRKDGSKFLANIIITALYDEKHQLRGFAKITRDVTELVKAQQRIQQQVEQLNALREIDKAILFSLDLNLTLSVFMQHASERLKVDAISILLLNSQTQMLEIRASRGFRSSAILRGRIRLGEGVAGRAALERRIEHEDYIENAESNFVRKKLIEGEDFISYYAAPLIAKGKVLGVMDIFHRNLLQPDDDWLTFFQSLAGQVAIAIDSATLFDELTRSNTELTLAYDATIEGWSRAMDLRDKETEGHTKRVTELTEELARAMGLSEKEIVDIRRGALLHDMGKMGVPDHILLKPGKLTDEEWVEMRKHPRFAFDMLAPITYLKNALDIPYCHHEKWDGSGYPRGLKGEQIPLAARLFAVVDVWDALRSDRPYRQGWTSEKVLTHIQSLSGTHFDPKIVTLFVDVISKDTRNTD